jgi:hypothetical protein
MDETPRWLPLPISEEVGHDPSIASPNASEEGRGMGSGQASRRVRRDVVVNRRQHFMTPLSEPVEPAAETMACDDESVMNKTSN